MLKSRFAPFSLPARKSQREVSDLPPVGIHPPARGMPRGSPGRSRTMLFQILLVETEGRHTAAAAHRNRPRSIVFVKCLCRVVPSGRYFRGCPPRRVLRPGRRPPDPRAGSRRRALRRALEPSSRQAPLGMVVLDSSWRIVRATRPSRSPGNDDAGADRPFARRRHPVRPGEKHERHRSPEATGGDVGDRPAALPEGRRPDEMG